MNKLHKQLKASVVISAVIAASLGAVSPSWTSVAVASSVSSLTATAAQTANIESSVRLRTAPTTNSNVLAYLKQGDVVTILEKTNDYFYKVRTSDGQVGYTSSNKQYISLVSTPVVSIPSVQTALIQASVRLRKAPSTNSEVLTYLKKGDKVTIVEKTNNYFYKIRTVDGVEGYTSSSAQYIDLIPMNVDKITVTPKPTPVAPVTPAAPSKVQVVEDVINAGMKYLGTPYEYGSSRNNTDTFDCSDFIRQIFMDGANFQLPADSRQQGAWVQENSKAVVDVSALKRGDLMFFMSNIGSSESVYEGIDKSKQTITHVALYLGDGQMLHTYSVASGGVRIDKLSASWMNRFMYGGTAVR